MKTSYDRSTDSLYIELRPLPSARTREIEPDVFLDIGADGRPVGYDIQHASTKKSSHRPPRARRRNQGSLSRRPL